MSKNILIVEDEVTLRESISRIFTKDRFTIDVAGSAEEALTLLDNDSYDVIITDIILPGMDGIEMISKIREHTPDQIVIIITAYASLDTAVKALRLGAYDYILKPIIHEEIRQVVRNAMKQKALQRENLLLKREIKKNFDITSVVGESAAIRKIISEVRKIADTKSTVLLLGETGTGKELFARVIHQNSSRRDMPFVPINCSAIPENLLETELFGYVRGAFTGAALNKKGLLEEADRGTVFLDEIGDMSLTLQAKLLRVLEDQAIRPVGSTKSTQVDIRLIAATNKDLKTAVQEGRFREDLYYRINVIAIEIPPLRLRRDDIGVLTTYYLEKYCREMGRPQMSVSPDALVILQNYSWPGNVRELQNVIERATLIAEGDTILPEHLPQGLKTLTSFHEEAFDKKLSIEEYTKAFILKHQDQFNEKQLAELLGITRKSLWEKRKRWGISRN